MPNKKINELSPRTPSLTDLIIVGDPSTGYSYKATISVLTAFAGSNIQFSSLGGISLTSPANGQVLQFNGTSWVNYTPTTWNTAYDRSLVSAAVSGSTTKTLTLTKQDGSTLTATWSDLNTDAVTSVFGRTGAVVATEGDYSLDLLSDVTLSTPTTNQVLQYNGTAWVNATFVAGINSLNGLTATTQTFATGTSGTDFAISSTTSTHTFNLPTASGTNRGALSSADWTTFNSKVGGSGTTNYLSKWTSSSALGNSLVFDNGTNVGIGTTSPSQKLEVNGSILSFNANPLFIMRDSDNDNNALYLGADFGFSGARSFGTFSINRNPANGTFFNTGRAASQINLESLANNSEIAFYTSTTNNATPSEAMRIFGTRNIAIGTGTDAGYRLDVSGTFRSTGDANINGLTVGLGGGNLATNTAIGYQSINNGSATGQYNVALGYIALKNVTSGNYNTALGAQALQQLSTAASCVSVGTSSSYSLTTGSFTTAVGTNALEKVTTSQYNTGIGALSLNNATGASNVALGYYSGYSITTGTYNTIIGTGTVGNGITTGSFNTIIGSQITGLSSSLSNTIILADGQGNQRIVVNSSGNVGLGGGTVDATYKMTVGGIFQFLTGSSFFGMSSGNLTLNNWGAYINNQSTSFSFLGQIAGVNTGSFTGSSTAVSINSITNLPLRFLTNNTEVGRFFANGNFAIGTTTDAGYKLDVNGTARVQNNMLLNATTSPTNGATTLNIRENGNPTGPGGSLLIYNDNGGGSTRISLRSLTGNTINFQSSAYGGGDAQIGTSIYLGTGQPDFQFSNANGSVFITRYTTRITEFNRGIVINEDGADSDTRIEGDTDVNLFFTKASTDRVGIGNNSPSYKFDISGDLRATTSAYFATSSGAVGIGTSSPNASAILDVSSTTKGFLPPRGTNAQMVAIATPATGLMFFDTTNNKLNVYDGINWVAVH